MIGCLVGEREGIGGIGWFASRGRGQHAFVRRCLSTHILVWQKRDLVGVLRYMYIGNKL